MDKIYKIINFGHPQLSSHFAKRFAQANVNLRKNWLNIDSTIYLVYSIHSDFRVQKKRKILQGYYKLQFLKCTASSELKKEKIGFSEGSVNKEEK